jgi:tetratricopeptide (TPR) repeat protein
MKIAMTPIKQCLCVFSLVVLFIPSMSFTQNSALEFDKKYYECEDKWVAFPKSDTDTSYMFGFIYLDEQAGFTFNLESVFMILETGEYQGLPRDSGSNVKFRLQPNTKLVAIIPADKLTDLNLPLVPDWLKYYKEKTDTLKSLISRGFHYNHVGASNIALTYLEKASEIDKHADRLEFELAYAYNATKQYDKAVSVLKSAIENNPKNYFFYRELGFAFKGLTKIEEAEQTYLKGIEMSDDNFQKSEMAVNMAQAYFELNDKKKFKKWAKLTKKYAKKDSDYLRYIKYWEKEINK